MVLTDGNRVAIQVPCSWTNRCANKSETIEFVIFRLCVHEYVTRRLHCRMHDRIHIIWIWFASHMQWGFFFVSVSIEYDDGEADSLVLDMLGRRSKGAENGHRGVQHPEHDCDTAILDIAHQFDQHTYAADRVF